MPQVDTPTASQAIACPFCGLGCDDLSLIQRDGVPSVDAAGCALAESRFGSALGCGPVGPRLHGSPVTLDHALAFAAERVNQARLPLFAGLAGDLTDIRGALHLAQQTGGVVDHRNGDALMRNSRVLQETGWITTSLGEARNRADLWVLVGDRLFERFPRLRDRLLRAAGRLHSDETPQLVLVGPWSWVPEGLQADRIPLALDALIDFTGVLRARLAGRPASGDAYPETAGLARQLAEARYPVIVFGAGELDLAHGDLTVRALAALVRDLNRNGRAALLPLAGADGETTAQQASAWHTGFGVRSSFHTGVPQFDPAGWSTERLLTGAEADLLVWISTLSADPPPRTSVPTLVLGHPAMRFAREPELFIPLAVPGVHRRGAIHRGDGLALLPLSELEAAELPSGAEVMARLLELIRED